MANRITKVYTKTGDKGETGLSGGKRVAKDCAEIQAIGDVDELNSVIGMVLAYEVPNELREDLLKIQHHLFNLGAELNSAEFNFITTELITDLEKRIDYFNAGLPALKNFILPGGGHAAATCHLARATCRRAERSVVMLNKQQAVNSSMQIYINRLSDFLFVACRVLVKDSGQAETLWSKDI